MREAEKDAIKTAAASVAGGAFGAVIYGIIGGVGLAATGAGFSMTLGPLIAIGAGLGATGYGIFWLGKVLGRTQRGGA